MKRVLALGLLLMALTFSSATFAQTQPVVNDLLGVTVSAPEGWENFKVQGNEKAVAHFRHPDSQSQIEVMGTKIINDDVAKVFFDTFRSQLLGADFSEAVAPKQVSIGDLQGDQVEYEFEHMGEKLRLVVYFFTKNDAAFVVVGYFRSAERDKYYDALKSTIAGLQFS